MIRKALVVGAILAAASLPARGLIFYGTGDPSHNVTDPGDGSGWQWEIQYGAVLATAIAPEYMITARHVGGGAGTVVSYQGQLYTTTAAWNRAPAACLHYYQCNQQPYYGRSGITYLRLRECFSHHKKILSEPLDLAREETKYNRVSLAWRSHGERS